MNIGFDAKSAFYNYSGIGNYSRHTIKLLNHYYSENRYFLFSPGVKKSFHFINRNKVQIVTPSFIVGKIFKKIWRTRFCSRSIKRNKIHLFHGLSNELPVGIDKSMARSIVTIHDLTFMRYPDLYRPIDKETFTNRFRYSCENADKVIAVSQQTKNDITDYFNIASEKIKVVYQGCDPIYKRRYSEEEKKAIIEKYSLPSTYILYVGTIEERKNLLLIVQALHEGNIDVPLVVVGKPTKYLQKVVAYISKNLLEHVYFLTDVPLNDLPAIYQTAHMFIYPSIFEGFGIPILEAMNSHVPVITSTGGCFVEAGADAPVYVNPFHVEEMIEAIRWVLKDEQKRQTMIEKGMEQVNHFNDEVIVNNLYKTYQEVMQS